MSQINIIGTGNVGTRLALILLERGHQIVLSNLSGEVPDALTTFPRVELGNLPPAELTLICTPDDQITTVSSKLSAQHGIIAHTSGATTIKVLDNHAKHGVFYPMQTLSKSRQVDMTQIPIGIEGNDDDTAESLTQLASFSSNVQGLNSKQRLAFHVAAVFVNNFSNHMFTIGEQLCRKHNLSFEILKPLIQETFDKMIKLGPSDSQTGPAVRGDKDTIGKHEEFLQDHPEYLDIYRVISKSIIG